MKKKILLIVAIALVGTMTFTLTSLRAQNDATPGAPPAGQAPPSGPRQPPPGFRGRPGMSYRNAVMMLKRAKMELQRSTDDFDGHRQSAMDACDKAVQELEAVQAAIAAAAAKANQATAPAAAPAPTPAPKQ